MFRLEEDRAVINRYGFNSEGIATVKQRLISFFASHDAKTADGLVGVNLGKNKESVDPIADYVTGIREMAPVADYLVINVSSPNTLGLRSLQAKEQLDALLLAAKTERDHVCRSLKKDNVPLLVKIAPDLNEEEEVDIASVIIKNKLDGVIISNTTISRDGLISPNAKETGGLSGAPLKHRSTQMIKRFAKILPATIPIVGVGGIECGQDAYDKIKAGATVVQIYTALAYEGPGLVARIKKELAECVERDGHCNISEAIGISNKL